MAPRRKRIDGMKPMAKILPAKEAVDASVDALLKKSNAVSPVSGQEDDTAKSIRGRPFKPGNKSVTQFKKGEGTKYKIDDVFLAKVQELGGANATYADCAHALGMSHQNFGRLVRENEKVTMAYEAGKAHHRISLRRRLTEMAMNGNNVAAAIFLAKNDLGMSDRAELTGKDGGPIEIRFIEGDENL